MRCLRAGVTATMVLLTPLLGGCLLSARPDVAPDDLLSLPLAGDYEVSSSTGLFETAGAGTYRARIETVSPGSYRLSILPPGEAKVKAPVVYDFRVLKGGDAGEYLAIHELPIAEGKEPRTDYMLIRAVSPDGWSVNSVDPEGDVATLLQAAQAAGLGMRLSGGSIELTGKLTGKALIDLFKNPDFHDQLVTSQYLQIRALPGQGFRPSP